MMNWYETRISGRVQHKGQIVPAGAKLYLSDAQKELHNRGEEKVVECEAPDSINGVAVPEDWKVFELSQASEPSTADEDLKEIPKSAADTTEGDSTVAPVEKNQSSKK